MIEKLKILIDIKGNCNNIYCDKCYWYNKEFHTTCVLYNEWLSSNNNNFVQFVMCKSIKELRKIKLEKLNELC
ncbi:MAG: hypothetical protein HPY57_14890 [Ignavibacteria bacterium]|nr:hypothetical protein [Ignavibacteria bacterium]